MALRLKCEDMLVVNSIVCSASRCSGPVTGAFGQCPLRRSELCRNLHILIGPRYSQAESDALDKLDAQMHIDLQKQGERRHKAVIPCVQCEGPFLPCVIAACPSAHHRLGRGHNKHLA